MSCEGCVNKIIAANEQKQKTIEVAQRNANESGEWWGIYEESGLWFAIPIAIKTGEPIQQYYSPKLSHTDA